MQRFAFILAYPEGVLFFELAEMELKSGTLQNLCAAPEMQLAPIRADAVGYFENFQVFRDEDECLELGNPDNLRALLSLLRITLSDFKI